MTSLTRFENFSPFQEMMDIRDRFNRMLNRSDLDEPLVAGGWIPACDIEEKPDSLVLRAELPGVRKEDIDIQYENGMMTIKGEKKFEKETKEKNFHRVERSYGSFIRSFTLPQNVNPDKINANFADGVLEVTIPKTEESKTKHIAIAATGQKEKSAH